MEKKDDKVGKKREKSNLSRDMRALLHLRKPRPRVNLGRGAKVVRPVKGGADL